jgi:xylulose-5-phosphate/fructose-6-phosphate phosphoketolase
MVYDNPDLITLVMVGDGEAETGPLATSWHSNKFLNPIRDGAVLPVLHLNGYKINNPTLLARISHEELEALFVGYGYTPLFVEGSDAKTMHQAMAATLEHAVLEIRKIQQEARTSGKAHRPRWPMIILRSPKGWTAPREVDGHYLEGFWRAHQIPLADVHTNPAHLQLLEKWLRSYKPEKLFDQQGRLVAELRALPPKGTRRMSANPVANGGLLKKSLDMPDFRTLGVEVRKPGTTQVGNAGFLGILMREIMRRNKDNFRLFGPDETQSNRLDATYEVTQKAWLAEYFPQGRRRRPPGPGRAGHGDAQRAHPGRVAGGLHPERAARPDQQPWPLTFSYARAIQQPALQLWNGLDVNVKVAQEALLCRAKCNRAAREGKYSEEMEMGEPALVGAETRHSHLASQD